MIAKSYAKVNIYLKIVGIKDNYHLISSRFMVVHSLYDIISFEKKEKLDDEFELIGRFSCTKKQNLIYKAYQKLLEVDEIFKKVNDFFKDHKVVVQKNIPEFAGLGGGSSNVATFLKMCNEFIGLDLSQELLLSIGSSLGADVAFFINSFESANVEGIGEKVTKFNEDALNLDIITPDIKCITADIYKEYRKNLLKNYDKISTQNQVLANQLKHLTSYDILNEFDMSALNDLFLPAQKLFPDLKTYAKKGWFFSGSGSSFFRRK